MAHEVYVAAQDTQISLMAWKMIKANGQLTIEEAAQLAISENMKKIEEFYRLEVFVLGNFCSFT